VVEVVATDEFTEWYGALDDAGAEDVGVVVELLAARGVTLPFPYSSDIRGASFALRELRVQSNGRPLRVFYAFDPARQAVLLLGGDKTGDASFYERMVRACERIWQEYLNETR
jgi:hypothetical protein